MISRCFSAGGVAGSAGTTSEPLIDHPMPSTARPKGACGRTLPGTVPPARAGAAPTGTWNMTQGIAAAMSSTAECVAKRGAAYFRRSPPFAFPNGRSTAAYTAQTAWATMACIGATSYHTLVTRPSRGHRNQTNWPLRPNASYNAAMSERAEMSGRELLEAALRGDAPAPPYVRLLGMRFTAVSDGSATFEMPAASELYNPNNIVHGGALTSLADSAMGFAVFSTLLPGENFTTAELHVNFIKAVTADSGMLRSIGRVVHRGQQIAVAEAEILDPQNQLIARASSTHVILQRRSAKPAPQPPFPPPPPEMALPPADPARFAAPRSPLERAVPTPTVSPSLTIEL